MKTAMTQAVGISILISSLGCQLRPSDERADGGAPAQRPGEPTVPQTGDSKVPGQSSFDETPTPQDGRPSGPEESYNLTVEMTSPFPGKAYKPAAAGTFPAIMFLHGSEGGHAGYSYADAKLFAEKGFVTFAYCYYDCDGQRGPLRDIDLSKTVEALDWLAALPEVGEKKVGLFGVSRGAEQALILASIIAAKNLNPLGAVAVHAPSDTIVGAYFPNNSPSNCYLPIYYCAVAWKWEDGYNGTGPNSLYIGLPILIEKYLGPVLISHGELDEVWGVIRSKNLNTRLTAAGLPPELHLWPNEKHVLTAEGFEKLFAALVTFFQAKLGS